MDLRTIVLVLLFLIFFPLILGFLFLTPFGWFMLGISGVAIVIWVIGRIQRF
jgi:hypothetical protein